MIIIEKIKVMVLKTIKELKRVIRLKMRSVGVKANEYHRYLLQQSSCFFILSLCCC